MSYLIVAHKDKEHKSLRIPGVINARRTAHHLLQQGWEVQVTYNKSIVKIE